MTPESGAASPAPAAPAANPSGDGKKPVANVTAAETVRRFVQASAQNSQSSNPPTADTKAAPPPPSEAVAGETQSQPSAAEPAQAAQPAEVKPEAPEGQQPETAPETPEAEGETEEVLSHDSQTLDAKTKERIQRRIDREVGKRKAQEAKTQQLEAELNALKTQVQAQQQQPPSPPVTAPSAAPLPEIKDPQALADYRKQAKDTIRWADRQLAMGIPEEGVRIDANTVWTKEQVLAIKENAVVAMEDKIPEQERYFQQQVAFAQQRTQAQQAARAHFPFLADPNAPEQKMVQAVYRGIPGLQALPNSDYIAGLLIEGQKALESRLKAAGQPPPPTPKAALPPPPKQRPPSDQAAVSTTGTAQRISPDASNRAAQAADMDSLKAKRGASTQDAVALLARRDLQRQNQGR